MANIYTWEVKIALLKANKWNALAIKGNCEGILLTTLSTAMAFAQE